MSQPGNQQQPGSLDEPAQQQLIQEIGRAIVRALPPGWQEAAVEYRAIGSYQELAGQLIAPNGTAVPLAPPMETAAQFAQLRNGMYQDDRGTWVSALYKLQRPGSYTVDFNGDQEPTWRTAPPPGAFAEELHVYPRPAGSVPEWLAAQTGAPTAPGTPAAPSGPVAAADGMRAATVFDDAGNPIMGRPAVAPDERDLLAQYLERAPVVLAARSYDTDRLDPTQSAAVPMTFHTDGSWVWPGAVAYYLRVHGVTPEPELVEHVRTTGFRLPDVDEPARERAVTTITGEQSG